jgi:hypothetical protein
MILRHFVLAFLTLSAWLSSDARAQPAAYWQPYRAVLPQQPTPLPPYATLVEDVPVEPVSDLDLAAMSVPECQSCPPLYGPNCVQSPLFANAPYGDPVLAPLADAEVWDWHLLPADVIWHSYWAGAKEPRMSGTVFEETHDDVTLFDVTLGGRTSVLRYGTIQQGRPEGWELQLEGASMLRLNLDENWDLEAVDFRFGVPLIYGRERWQWKFSYYHLSSHLGDEFAIRQSALGQRINFSRDALVLGYSFFPRPAWRWYAETGWAFYADEGTDPWEFQFGVDYAQPGPTGGLGTPFFAVNGHLREELNYGGNLVTQAGWLWRGPSDKLLRTGVHYYNGKSNQFEFYNQFEQQIGLGLWYEY